MLRWQKVPRCEGKRWHWQLRSQGQQHCREFAGALQKLLMLAWAYGESLLDVRTLLAKGKVPMLKAETEWKLPLEKLGMLAEVLKE